jgi:hypothetical protein
MHMAKKLSKMPPAFQKRAKSKTAPKKKGGPKKKMPPQFLANLKKAKKK